MLQITYIRRRGQIAELGVHTLVPEIRVFGG